MDDTKPVSVSCLYNVCDLQRKCESHELKFSEDTNRYLLRATIRQLGPYIAQKLVKSLVDKGEVKWDEDGFDVEAILDYSKDENDKDFYLIKWKGWSHAYNTWEPREHLDCEDLLEKFHKGLTKKSARNVSRRPSVAIGEEPPNKKERVKELMEKIVKKSEITPLRLLKEAPLKDISARYNGLCINGVRVRNYRLTHDKIYNKRTKTHRQLKEEMVMALKRWEKHLNSINSDPAPISVENNVDLEGPPATFSYINDYKVGNEVIIPDDPMVGCECGDCFDNKRHCCGPNAGAEFAYYKHSRARVPPGTPIYECNRRCNCSASCPNRVVQHGRKHRVCIFRTRNCRGWGVKALQKIKKGSFVMEYVGEVITHEEAERRGKVYDLEGRTYLFDLDYNDGDCPYTVDAGFYGNVSHFVNHSCDPNLAVYGVWINHLDPRLPRIALFAQKDIQKGEELTFDYLMTGDTTSLEEFKEGDDVVNAAGDGAAGDVITSQPSDPQDTTLVASPEALPPAPASPFLLPPDPVSLESRPRTDSIADDDASDISKTTSEVGSVSMDQPSPFIRRNLTSPSPAMKYRIMCQCGSKNCRKYLF